MAVRISLKPDVSTWIKEHTDMSVFDENDETESRYLAFLRGNGTVTMKQVSEISRKLHVPYGYFFMTRIPEHSMPLMEFRTIGSTGPIEPSSELRETVLMMRARQAWARQELIRTGVKPIRLPVLRHESKVDVLAAAEQIRGFLEIQENWFANRSLRNCDEAIREIRDRIDGVGIFVMQNGVVGSNTKRPLDVDEFRAFALPDQYAPLIFINRRDRSEGRLFSLFHELVHVCLGRSDLYNGPEGSSKSESLTKIEVFCNAVTGELLAPACIFRQEWEKARGSLGDRVDVLRNRFLCSRIVLARRAVDIGLANKDEYKVFAQKATSAATQSGLPAGASSGGDGNRNTVSRVSKRFLEMVINSTEQGDTMYTDAFRLTGTNRRTFQNFAQQAKDGTL